MKSCLAVGVLAGLAGLLATEPPSTSQPSVSTSTAPASWSVVEVIRLGDLSIRLPVEGLQSVEVAGQERPRLIVNYAASWVMFATPEHHSDEQHLVRPRLPEEVRRLVSSEAEARRAVYNYRNGYIPDLVEELSPEGDRSVRQLQALVRPHGIRRSEVVRGRQFTALVSWFERSVEILGWLPDESTEFAITVGLRKSQEQRSIRDVAEPVLSGITLEPRTATRPAIEPEVSVRAAAGQLRRHLPVRPQSRPQ